MEKLRLVRPEKKHEKQEMEYLEEFYADKSEAHGVGGLERYKDDYDGWLEKLVVDRVQMPNEERVPAETFFLMKRLPRESHMLQEDVELLVGMINIRLVLNDNLWKFGGHIDYSIRPSERRKGYNKVNLYLALKVCQNHGIEVVLLDCDKDNIGSAKTMRALEANCSVSTPIKSLLVRTQLFSSMSSMSMLLWRSMPANTTSSCLNILTNFFLDY